MSDLNSPGNLSTSDSRRRSEQLFHRFGRHVSSPNGSNLEFGLRNPRWTDFLSPIRSVPFKDIFRPSFAYSSTSASTNGSRLPHRCNKTVNRISIAANGPDRTQQRVSCRQDEGRMRPLEREGDRDASRIPLGVPPVNPLQTPTHSADSNNNEGASSINYDLGIEEKLDILLTKVIFVQDFLKYKYGAEFENFKQYACDQRNSVQSALGILENSPVQLDNQEKGLLESSASDGLSDNCDTEKNARGKMPAGDNTLLASDHQEGSKDKDFELDEEIPSRTSNKCHKSCRSSNETINLESSSSSVRTKIGQKRNKTKVQTAAPLPECSICKNGFKQLSILKEHEQIHRHEKKFDCQLCKKTLQELTNTRSHLRTHRQEN